MKLNLTAATLACLYCPRTFPSPKMRRDHLREVHGVVVDTRGSEAAQDEFLAYVMAKAYPAPNDPDGIPDFDHPRGARE